MEVLTCPKCRQHTITNSNGHTHQGLFVHRATRSRDRAQFSQEDNEISKILAKLSLKSIPQKIDFSADKFHSQISDFEDAMEILPERSTKFEIISEVQSQSSFGIMC
ncbi:hypothetical protein O181_010831 [Austropuccinia psidii MF-1]|uniref:Uncharacterized protein n=1 Tax=Austropuccinia psidii MF-1 TaxID=1389203 RepID=A0A9Q3GKT1_9BASI|nr:hypothetical protein [Austropuccinia psidii MF-1]